MQPVLTSILFALVATNSAGAWFRVACTDPLVQVRVDPVISPNQTPSQHVHQYAPSTEINWPGFDITCCLDFRGNATYDTLRVSSCTSCRVTEDLSNYWFPKLYFQDPKTKLFEPVGNGGLLVYYQNRGDGDVRNGGAGLKAFPQGFKMITGSPVARSKKYTEGQGSQAELRERAVQWACLRYGTPYPGYDGHGFPTTDCEAGFNARLHMPACWDGKNVDSADHMSHVAYLSGLDNGVCPSTHPVPLMKLFYEVTWDVHQFAARWTEADGWPFVYATGDPTGYSWHGDFQNGWATTALQNAIDKCNNPNDDTGNGVTEACQYLTVIPASTANQCKIPAEVKETINGKLAKLPG
ncbi:WSC domain protein [Ceratobasidium sp. AG-Ba]|nr:WSC domain protein [Ceratobasidium sp. AG-Ba]